MVDLLSIRHSSLKKIAFVIAPFSLRTRKEVGVGLWVLCVALAVGDTSATDQPAPPAWSGRSIASFPATNQPAKDAAPPTQGPARRALTLLDELGSPTVEEPWSGRRSLYMVGEDREIDEANLDERLEQARLRVILQEAEQLARGQQFEEGQRLLLNALDTVQFDTTRMAVYSLLGSIAFRAQDFESAEAFMREALTLGPTRFAVASNLAAVQMTLGHFDEALKTLESIQLGMISNPALLFSIHFNLACVHSLMGNEDAALQNLFRAAEADAASTFTSLGDPQLDRIRTHLRFRELQTGLERVMGGSR